MSKSKKPIIRVILLLCSLCISFIFLLLGAFGIFASTGMGVASQDATFEIPLHQLPTLSSALILMSLFLIFTLATTATHFIMQINEQHL